MIGKEAEETVMTNSFTNSLVSSVSRNFSKKIIKCREKSRISKKKVIKSNAIFIACKPARTVCIRIQILIAQSIESVIQTKISSV